jgi:hypothetical protein
LGAPVDVSDARKQDALRRTGGGDGRRFEPHSRAGNFLRKMGPFLGIPAAELPSGEGPEDDFRRLSNELMRVMLAKQLFTFVTAKPVEKLNGDLLIVSRTNNEAEWTLRSPAQARGTGRANKTVVGARRQTMIVSVLESLRQHLSSFTQSSVIEEIRRRAETGRSCFARWVSR